MEMDDDYERKKRLYRMKILEGDECKIPSEHLYRFTSTKLGCNTLKFSYCGRFLACAVTKENSRTLVPMYDVEDGVKMYELQGHKNLIHDIDWHPSSEYLVTSSSDLSATVRY